MSKDLQEQIKKIPAELITVRAVDDVRYPHPSLESVPPLPPPPPEGYPGTVNQRNAVVTSWGTMPPAEVNLNMKPEVIRYRGCEKEGCVHETHSPRAPVYRIVLPDKTQSIKMPFWGGSPDLQAFLLPTGRVLLKASFRDHWDLWNVLGVEEYKRKYHTNLRLQGWGDSKVPKQEGYKRPMAQKATLSWKWPLIINPLLGLIFGSFGFGFFLGLVCFIGYIFTYILIALSRSNNSPDGSVFYQLILGEFFLLMFFGLGLAYLKENQFINGLLIMLLVFALTYPNIKEWRSKRAKIRTKEEELFQEIKEEEDDEEDLLGLGLGIPP